ncbi:MAG: CapA family protein [Planctomycetia bacterium]
MNRWLTWVAIAVLISAAAAGGAEPAGPARKESSPGTVAVAFVGDIMLDNGPGHAIASGRDPFAACAEILLDADFTVGNLECVLGKGGKQVLKEYSFRAASDSPRYLKRYFSALAVANNHAMDFGPEGLVECLRILAAEGLPQVGGGRDLAAARRPLVLQKHGITIALVAANGFQAAKSAAGVATPGVAPLEEAAILADIAASRKTADFVVPLVHWGPELVPQPREADRVLARKMIDAGAAAVIGGHPHVTQTVDVHAGAPIVYSLGNFVFDYYPVDPPEWTGWVAKLSFAKGKPVALETRAVVLDAAGLPRPATEDD